MLLALLDQYSDDVDRAADEMGAFFDHLRQVGVRGFVAERLDDPDYVYRPRTGRSQAEQDDKGLKPVGRWLSGSRGLASGKGIRDRLWRDRQQVEDHDRVRRHSPRSPRRRPWRGSCPITLPMTTVESGRHVAHVPGLAEQGPVVPVVVLGGAGP